MFIYAWTADPRIFWMWPVVGLTVCSSFHVVESVHKMVKLDLHVLFIRFISGGFHIFGGLVSTLRCSPFSLHSRSCTPLAMAQWRRLLWQVKA
jgi:hypothetical protein